MDNNKNSEHYIWRTTHDDKVRGTHAAREGKMFSWTNPPVGGHPGEDHNCRCWAEPIKDGITPVYPELILIPALKTGRILKTIRNLSKYYYNKSVTIHGHQRLNQRNISAKEIQSAIKSAKNSGQVTTKTGKYGTPQNHYKGSNGVTVIKETHGRNAGKIITVWRHK